MNPELKRLVSAVNRYSANPGVNPGIVLQRSIVESGESDRFSEDDLIEAAKGVGCPADEVADWLQELASWL
jgi:hypothetical protein